MTNTTLSRRRLLASMPAAAAAMVPVAASAVCRLPTDGEDPVFAAIKQHRKAFDAYREACAVNHRLREERKAKRNPEGVYLGEVPEQKWITETVGAQRLDREIPTGRMVPSYATYPAAINNHVPTGCTDIEVWKAAKHRELKQWSGVCEGSPISIAWQTQNDAHEALLDAAIALNMKPTTLAGVAALLDYVVIFPKTEIWTDADYHFHRDDDEEDHEESDEYCGEEDENLELGFLKDILVTLADALRNLSEVQS